MQRQIDLHDGFSGGRFVAGDERECVAYGIGVA